MLSFDSTQESILASDYKLLYWLFEIDSTYYWSTKYVPNTVYNSQIYTFKVLPDSFKRIRLAAPDRESGSISTLADTYFEISNKDNTYASSDFKNSSVIIKLVMSDGTNTELMAQWGFNVMSCVDLDQRLGFNCEDFLQPFLEGDYPKTKLVSSIRPAIGDPDDDLCLPVIFGTAYIPIRSQWIPSERYYMLGTTADAFTVSEIRSPREFGRSIFESGSFTFTYTDKTVGNTTYRTMRPAIAETDTPGVYATGVWTSGEKMMDPFFKITRTGSSTDPATVIRLVLQDMGVPAAKIDAAGSFAAATAVYTGWGLDFNGAFYKKDSCRAVLARLLIMCNSTLRVTDKIELHPLELNNSDSVATHTGAEILKESFSYNNIIQEASVAASVAFQLASEPVDELVPITIPVKEDSSGAILDNISEDLLDIRWVQDSQDVQRIGILHFQRKYLGEANPSYKTKMSELGVQPEDIVTVTGSRYGGPHYILVNELSINKDASIDIGGIAYSDELDNWSDLSPDVVDIEQEYIIFNETWTPIFSGPGSTPDSGTGANVLPGEIIVGDYSTVNYITINPISTQILLNDDGTDRVVIGHLGGGDYGIAIVDPDGNTVVRIDSSQATFAGWTIAPTRLYSITSSHGIVLDSDEMFLSIYNETFATLGIQAQYNAGAPRFYVGDGSSNYFRYEDGVITVSGLTVTGGTWDDGEGGAGDNSSPIMPSGSDLVLYYKLDESTGLTAYDSAGSQNGTLTDFIGDNSQWVTGITNNGIYFNGSTNQYINAGNSFQSLFQSNFSVSFWIKFDDGRPVSGQDYIWGVRDQPGAYYTQVFSMLELTGQIVGYYGNKTGGVNFTSAYPVFPDGQMTGYYHIAFTVEQQGAGVQALVYVNGILPAIHSTLDGWSASLDMSQFDSTRNIYIGTWNQLGSVGTGIAGALDEYRLFNKTLSSNEVQGLYINDR